jgi:hypothetical protein
MAHFSPIQFPIAGPKQIGKTISEGSRVKISRPSPENPTSAHLRHRQLRRQARPLLGRRPQQTRRWREGRRLGLCRKLRLRFCPAGQLMPVTNIILTCSAGSQSSRSWPYFLRRLRRRKNSPRCKTTRMTTSNKLHDLATVSVLP